MSSGGRFRRFVMLGLLLSPCWFFSWCCFFSSLFVFLECRTRGAVVSVSGLAELKADDGGFGLFFLCWLPSEMIVYCSVVVGAWGGAVGLAIV